MHSDKNIKGDKNEKKVKKQRTLTRKKRAFPAADYLSQRVEGLSYRREIKFTFSVLCSRNSNNMTSGINIFFSK